MVSLVSDEKFSRDASQQRDSETLRQSYLSSGKLNFIVLYLLEVRV